MLVDLSIVSSGEGAKMVNEEGIHILIDLNGHTSGVRILYVCMYVCMHACMYVVA